MATPEPVTSAASAPGKLILFGEHSVVYGKKAVATCLSDLRVMVTATTRADAVVEVSIPDIDRLGGPDSERFVKSWTVEELRGALGEAFPGSGPTKAQIPGPGVAEVLETLCRSCGTMNAKALAPTVYLAAAIFGGKLGVFDLAEPRVTADGSAAVDEDTVAARVGVDAGPSGPVAGAGVAPAPVPWRGVSVSISLPTLPVAAGLGSSAAFSVATSAALLDLYCRVFEQSPAGVVAASAPVAAVGSGKPSDPASQFAGGRMPSQAAVTIINEWAFAAETLFHGRPSGLDNTVSAYGGALAFVKPAAIDRIEGMPPMRLLVTNTRVPKDTKALVAGVRVLHDRLPAVVQPMLAAMEAVAEAFASTVASASTDAAADDMFDTVGRLMDMNQSLLDGLGVGHPSITALCAASKAHGLHSKLTGAGGGGCCYTLIPPTTPDAVVEALSTDLHALGYQCFETTAGGAGVLLHTGVTPLA